MMLPNLPLLKDRLVWARDSYAKISQDKAAKKLKITQPSLSAAENGEVARPRYLAEAAKLYGVPYDWMAYNDAAQCENKFVHIRDDNSFVINELDVTAHGGCGALDGAINESSIGEWAIPSQYVRGHIDTSRARLHIITVIGDSMEPDFPNGCRVMVNTADRSPTPAGYFVVWDGNGLVMKRVEYIPHSSPARVRISSINKGYMDYEVTLDEAHINGRVIGMWKWV